MIQGICFDLDGVLIHTDQLHYLAWKGLADRLGIPFDRAQGDRCRGISRMESLEIVLERTDHIYSAEEKERFAREKNEAYRTMLARLSPSGGCGAYAAGAAAEGIPPGPGLGQQKRRTNFGAYWTGEISGCGSRWKLCHPFKA